MGILLDILSGIGNTLDVPGSMVRDALGGENPFDQLMAPWRSDNRLSGRDLARRWGMASNQDTWGNLAGGIGLELATDPMNLLAGAGLLRRAFQGAKIAKATRAVDAANDASMMLRAKGWMPEEVAQLTKIQDPMAGKWIVRDPPKPTSIAPNLDVSFSTSSDIVPFKSRADAVKYAKQYGLRPPELVPPRPLRLYHETAAPPFEPHEFMPDPGTNNWLGKGTYFVKRPGESAGAYSQWDKSKTILPSDPEEAAKLVQAFQQKGQSAPRTMMSFVDSRNPYTFEEPATLRDMLMGARNLPEKPLWKQNEFVNSMMQKYGPFNWQAKATPEELATFEQLRALPPIMSRKVARQELLKKLRASQQMIGELPSATKGDIWAMLNANGKSPDEITDILRNAGYDAIQHDPRAVDTITDQMQRAGLRPPDIDSHSELVAFNPSQIYQPFIAPALQVRPEQLKRIPKSLKAAFAAYQAGVLPTRGRSQE